MVEWWEGGRLVSEGCNQPEKGGDGQKTWKRRFFVEATDKSLAEETATQR